MKVNRLLIFATCLIVLLILCTTPVLDGDLFWHMAYAKQILQRGSLILDHTTFSWTPTSNRTIYNAWAGQLIFYGLWEKLGPWSVFALRFLCVVLTCCILWRFAAKLKTLPSFGTGIILLLWALASSGAYQTKPEIFSFVFFNHAIGIYFYTKSLSLEKKDPARWYYLMPLLFLFWVNFHGGFILALPFLVLTAVADGLSLRYSPNLSAGKSAFRHQMTAWGLSFLALFLNPYGWRYPLQLFEDYVLGKTPRPDVAWNDAHLSIFSPQAWAGHFIFYFFLSISIWGFLAFRCFQQRKRTGGFDFSLILLPLFYAPLFGLYFRTTFYWPAIFAFSVFYMMRLSETQPDVIRSPARPFRTRLAKNPPGELGGTRRARQSKIVNALSFVLFFGMALEAGWQEVTRPVHGSWFGFGISDINPVQEAQFLKHNPLGPHLYNIFDSGGYLLWRLSPDYKVMTDSRSFPYLDWFQDQYRFSTGEEFGEFLAKYPSADTAVIDLKNEDAWRNFLKASDWQLVFYGPTAAVFVRKARLKGLEVPKPDPHRFARLKNGDTALRVFHFAATTGDLPAAWGILDLLEKGPVSRGDQGRVVAAKSYRAAHQALRKGDYESARVLLEQALSVWEMGDRDHRIRALLRDRHKLRLEKKEKALEKIDQDVARLVAPP